LRIEAIGKKVVANAVANDEAALPHNWIGVTFADVHLPNNCWALLRPSFSERGTGINSIASWAEQLGPIGCARIGDEAKCATDLKNKKQSPACHGRRMAN
jgi:hypothetical protein